MMKYETCCTQFCSEETCNWIVSRNPCKHNGLRNPNFQELLVQLGERGFRLGCEYRYWDSELQNFWRNSNSTQQKKLANHGETDKGSVFNKFEVSIK